MSRKPFYLSLRSGVWYAKIVDPKTGNQLSAVSTGQTDQDAAILTVSRWLIEGIKGLRQQESSKLFRATWATIP